jgi:ATP-dependent DNA helicase PIF1
MNEVISKSNFQIYSDLNELLDKIRKVITDKNGWIERKEICKILNLPLNTQLVENMNNSKIGQILYNYLRREDFIYQKVQLDPEDKYQYEIWMRAENIDIPDDFAFEEYQKWMETKGELYESDSRVGLLSHQHEADLNEILQKLHGENYIIVESKQKASKRAAKPPETEDESDGDNEDLDKITELINQGENLFITGYAGTGKSYILNKLKKKFQIDVTSTTGLAAVNVQGQTIHSWAGVGICNKPIKNVIEKILQRTKLKKQISECKILAIDEISMLDARTFDYIDEVLRNTRDGSKPFGGIQLLLFGDFFQLPPVEKESGFCFNSKTWQALNLKTVFLEKVYRQNDENFIKSLNNLRLNQLTEDDVRLFYDREVNYNTYESDILHIFSTNKEADNYNTFKFNSVQKPLYVFNSADKIHRKRTIIEVDKNNLDERLTNFDLKTLETFDKSCKAPSALELKEGCRIMLLKNLNFNKGLINGSTGTVLELKKDEDEEYILVRFDNEVEEVISKHTFEAYRDGDVVVSREQYPLRLAYGITIHKSQGMTLEKLIVDCNRIFECGQVYVALSRIKSIDGLYLKSFNPQKVWANEEVVEFYKSVKP